MNVIGLHAKIKNVRVCRLRHNFKKMSALILAYETLNHTSRLQDEYILNPMCNAYLIYT